MGGGNSSDAVSNLDTNATLCMGSKCTLGFAEWSIKSPVLQIWLGTEGWRSGGLSKLLNIRCKKIMWTIRSLFELPKKLKEQYERVVAARDSAERNIALAYKVVFEPLETTLRNLLEAVVT